MRIYTRRGATSGRLLYATFAFLIIILLLTSPVALHPRSGSEYNPYIRAQLIGSGSLQHEVGLLLLAVFAFAVFMRRRFGQIRMVKRIVWPVALFFLWACISIIWSDGPVLTAKRVAALCILAAGAFVFERLFSFRAVLQFTFTVGMVSVLVGLPCEVATGTFHPFREGYRFWGLLDPNFTGWNCSLALIAIVALARNAPKASQRWYSVAFALIALFLVLTKSRGALAGAILGLLTYVVLRSRRRRVAFGAYIVAVVICLLTFLGGGSADGTLLDPLLLGRNGAATLSGRIPFWENQMLPAVMARPIAGYGYGAFWTVRRYEQGLKDGTFFFPDAHNSIIEVALSVGAVGLILYLGLLAMAFQVSVRLARRSRDACGPFCAGILVCSFINSTLSSIQLEAYLSSFILFLVLATLAYTIRPAESMKWGTHTLQKPADEIVLQAAPVANAVPLDS